MEKLSFKGAESGVSLIGGSFEDEEGNVRKEEFFIFNNKEYEKAGVLKNFRTSNSPFLPNLVKEYEEDGIPLPSRDGLEDTKVSGCGQFGQGVLDLLIENIVKSGASRDCIVIADLRAEPHCIMNGQPVSWYNKGDKIGEGLNSVEVDELNRSYIRKLQEAEGDVEVFELLEKKEGYPVRTAVSRVKVKSVQTEEMMVHRQRGLGYQRIPITDHEMAEPHELDLLLRFYWSLPRGAHVHFHCAAGRGRTTMALVIMDMLRNRHRFRSLSFIDFVRRQHLLGGINAARSARSKKPEKKWKQQDAVNRFELLQLVYEFSRDEEAHQYGMMYFSTWLGYRMNKCSLTMTNRIRNHQDMLLSDSDEGVSK
mmetsp:Transcript_34322/g.96742  ORF Transcript_34322/g.96742 Transcript_34322/m.96742 type:complete len:366 (-) Transcript_34322:24-1121(-)